MKLYDILESLNDKQQVRVPKFYDSITVDKNEMIEWLKIDEINNLEVREVVYTQFKRYGEVCIIRIK